MNRLALTAPLGTLLLSAVLAACGAQNLTSTVPPISVADQVLVPVTLSNATLSGQSNMPFRSQGVPFKDDGSPAVQSVHVQVRDANGNTIKFNSQSNEDPSGTQDFIELTPTITTATVRLFPGTYTFDSTGLSTASDGIKLARGLTSNQVVGGSTPTTVNIKLQSVIGQASLVSALPLTYAMPGQVIDLNLVVQSPEVGGKRYTIPLADFNLQPNLDANFVAALSMNNLGVRIQVPAVPYFNRIDWAGDIFQDALDNTPQDPHEIYVASVSFHLPAYPVATLGVDLVRPSLTAQQGTAPFASGIGGQIGDNVGVTKLEIYQGVILVASTNASDGVQKIVVDTLPSGTGISSSWHASGPFNSGAELTAIAQDTSGNETRATLTYIGTP